MNVLGASGDPIIVLVIFAAIAAFNLVRWIKQKQEENKRRHDPNTPRPQRMEPSSPPKTAGQPEPGQVLKKFLEEMTGVPVQRPAAGTPRAPAHAATPTRPQRQEPARHRRPQDAPRRPPRQAAARPKPSPQEPEHPTPRPTAPKALRDEQPAPAPRKPEPGSVAADWMQGLPENPLKRAIALSEILGPPRAIRRAVRG